MNKLYLILLTFYCNSLEICATISDRRLCGDPKCSVPVAEAVAILKYNAIEPYMLSFKPNTRMKIYSKSAGSNLKVWGAEINGKRGYVPTNHIKEVKVLKKKLNHLVETELISEHKIETTTPTIINTNIPNGVLGDVPAPDKVQKPYDVFDGTTVYHDTSGAEQIVTTPKVNVKNETIEDEDIIVEDYNDEEEDDEEQDDPFDVVNEVPSLLPLKSTSENLVSNQNSDDTLSSNSQVPLAATNIQQQENNSINNNNNNNNNNNDVNNIESSVATNSENKNDSVQELKQKLVENTEEESSNDNLIVVDDDDDDDDDNIVKETNTEMSIEKGNEPDPLEKEEQLENDDVTESTTEQIEMTTETLNVLSSTEMEMVEVETTTITNLDVPPLTELPQIDELTTTESVIIEETTETEDTITVPTEILTTEANIISETTPSEIITEETVTTQLPNSDNDPVSTETDLEQNTESSTATSEQKIDDIFEKSAESFSDNIFNDYVPENIESEPSSGYFDSILDSLINFGYVFEQTTDPSNSLHEHIVETNSAEFLFKLSDSYNIIIYMIITSITVLIFTLGYYYIERSRQDSKLIKIINELDKERNILRNELELRQNDEPQQDHLIEQLKMELKESQRIRAELEEQNINLEKELETATETGLELNRLLTECLTSQSNGDSIEETLQKQLNEQQMKITELTIGLNDKTKENESIQFELNKANVRITELTNELNVLVDNLTKLEKDSLNKEEELTKRIKELQTKFDEIFTEKNQQITKLNDELKQLRDELKQTQHNLNVRENELTLLKENLVNLQQHNNRIMDVDVQNVFDVNRVRAELQEVIMERDQLFKKLQTELDAKSMCEKQIVELNNFNVQLNEKLQSCEKDKIEIQTRLDVLSSYFKEKEAQLQKELVKQEELWLQNQDATNSTVERIKLLQEEIQNYKSQNEMLRNEIVDQEVSLKSQISVLEKKNHENWLLLRQAERRLEDSKQECSQLRNRLIIVERNLNAEEKVQYRVLSPLNSTDNVNSSPIHLAGDPSGVVGGGGSGSSPPPPPLLLAHRRDDLSLPFMGLPPPPPPHPGGLPFLPPPPGAPLTLPPPPNLFPGDRRPPPLGRMSSPPPPPTSFSPPPTFSPYDQGRDSPRMYDDYDNEHSYSHRPPPSPPSMYHPTLHHHSLLLQQPQQQSSTSASSHQKMNWDDSRTSSTAAGTAATFHLNEQRMNSKQKGGNMMENA